MELIVRLSFNLRHMFYVVTFMAVAVGATVWLARHIPEVFLFAFLISCVTSIFGFGIAILASVMLFSVYTSDTSAERKLNIAKCANLLLIGALMLALPVLVAIAIQMITVVF